MAWSGFGQTHLAQKQAGVQESSGPVLAECNQPTTIGIDPLLDSVAFFHRRFGPFTQDQAGSDLVLADCVRFWPNGSGPEASRCARVIRPGQRLEQ